jgi:PKD repeat protein
MKQHQKFLIVLISFVLFVSSFVHAQTPIRCYTNEMQQALQQQFPGMESSNDFETWMQSQVQQMQTMAITNGVYSIPVVVHVIHNGEAVGTGTNVSFAAIQSQIDVLNEDFRRLFGSNGYNTHPDGADTKIEFCLAQRRPDGSAFAATEPGVNRINRTTAGFTLPPFTTAYIDATIKPYTYNNNIPTATRGWDPAKYMNIWLCNISGGILGYAQFPESPLGGMGCGTQAAATDGVVFLYNSIGKSAVTGFTGAYNEGRTATHEIGHWLGLRHIWGDGGCTVDDFCNDTPEAAAANFGCPAGTNSCTAAPDAGPDMIENYMDYTDDLCMNIFTNDQKMRMRTVLENSPRRVSLINSDACTPPNPNDASIVGVANPKGDNCPGAITPSVTLKNRGSANLTSATISYNIDNGTATTFNWTGSLTPGSTATVTLPNFTSTLGQHMFKAWSSLPNNATDPSTIYDTSGIEFMISNGINAPFVENFDGSIFPPDVRWEVINTNSDCYEWTGASATSITGVFNNNAAQFPGFGNTSASTETLVSPILTLPCNATAANVQFDVAYRRRNTTTANYERLYVEISQDCGTTWTATPVYDKTGTALQVLTTTLATYYTPVGITDWRTETIDLLPFVTTISKNIRLRFRAVAANGNNIYIDNFKFNATTPGEINVTQSGTTVLDGGYSNVGNVSVGSTVTSTFTINNTGTSNLTLTGPIAVSGTGFTLGSTFGTTTVPAGGSTTFSVVFSPTAAGTVNGTVSFGTNDCDESTFDFTIIGVGAVSPPVANFTASSLTVCAGTAVTFTNTSTNATSYSWNFGGGVTPNTSTATSPTVTFSTPGVYTIALTATNSFGSDVETKNNYITVLSSAGQALPLTEGFVNATFPYANWSIVNANASPTTWVRTTAAGNAPTTGNSLMFDNFNYNDGDDDQVKLPGVSLTGMASAQLQFDVAYAPYNATNFDGLEVLVSSDCGNTFTSVYSKSNTTLATAAASTTIFTPTATQWRTETINLTPYVGSTKLIVAFKNLSGYGNRLFVDNINLTGVPGSTPPVASYTSSTSTICAGSTITYTNTSTGSPTSYSWSFPGGTPSTSTSANPVVTYATAGTYSVSMTATNGAGSNTVTQTNSVTVNPTPVVTSTNQTICTGSSATLVATGSIAGGTYAWSGGQTGNSITVSPAATTSYTVTYTASGCTSAASTSTVTVNAVPTVTSTNQTICIGSAATLTATGSVAGGTFAWSGGQTGNSITVSPTATTSYTVTYTANGCTSTAATSTVTVNNNTTPTFTQVAAICSGGTFSLPTTSNNAINGSWSPAVNNAATTTYTFTPIAGQCAIPTTMSVTVNPTPTVTSTNQTICAGGSATLTATPSTTGGTFAWSGGQTGNSITVSPATTTSYTVTYTKNGCTSAPATSTVTVNAVPTVTSTNQTICTGSAATLTATGSVAGGTFAWSGGQTGNSITVSPTATTSYTVTYTANGCTSTAATSTVTVNNNTTPTFTQVAAICSGGTFSLPTTSNNAINGSWSPAINNAATTTYTFTPIAGQCAIPTTMSVTVNPTPVVTSTSQTICAGSSATLVATGSIAGGTYAWSGGQTGNSITVSPAATTSYTVTYTASGCTSAASTSTVTVNAVPTVTLTNQTICIGSAATLTATGSVAGGTYAWSGGQTGNSITVSPTATTSYTVNYTANGCTSTAATSTVTVNNNTTPTFTQVAAICSGGTFSLPTTSNNAISGSWSPVINNTSTTTYTFTPIAGQCAVPTTMSVTVNPTPVVTSTNQTICAGSSATLVATGSIAGGTYAWSGGQSGNSITVSPTTTTSYTVTYTANGCTSTPSTSIVTVNDVPVVDLGPDTVVCENNLPLQLTAQSSIAGCTFSWNNGASGQSIPVTAGGTYSVNGTVNGCTGSDAITVVVDPCSGIDELSDKLRIYPNPTLSEVFIDFGQVETFNLVVLNALGQRILERSGSTEKCQIDLSAFDNGMYMLVIEKNAQIIHRQIIKND